MAILQYSPGSLVTIVLQTLGSDGYRQDGYTGPFVNRLILPDLSESSLYPLDMIRIDTGLYYHKFTLPSGPSAIGSYLVDITYSDIDDNPLEDLVQVVCTSSTGGSFSISPS